MIIGSSALGDAVYRRGVNINQSSIIPITDERIYYPHKISLLVSFMAEEGIPSKQVLEGTGLDPDTLSLPDTRTSIRQLVLVFSNMRKLSADPRLALRVGQRICASDYGLYGLALMTCTSLRHCLRFAISHHRLATPTTTMLLSEEGDFASFSFSDSLGMDELYRFNMDFQLSLICSLFRDFLGVHQCFNRVHVNYSESTYGKYYEEVLMCPVVFDQSSCEFQFSRDLLDQPLPKSNAITEAMVTEMCDALLLELSCQNDLTRKISDLLIRDATNMPSCDEVASELAMTPRTLRRKLTSQGTSFQKILDEVRRELSIKYLRGTSMGVADVAEQVGFSDVTTFRKAFKRWTNKTPSMFRPRIKS